MAKKVVQKNIRDGHVVQAEAKRFQNREGPKVVIQKKVRDVPKLPVFSSPHLLHQIKAFTHSTDKHYYLGFGGLGDALLLMAICWNDPKARVVFFANQIPFTRSFFELFGIPVFLHDNIMGTRIATHIYELMRVLPGFRQSAHLADGLNYNDWSNEKKYASRISGQTGWIDHLGKEQFDKPVVVIAPSGSNKEIQRQRYLHHHEYQQLVEQYLKNEYRVYVTGSISDLHHFKLIDKENFYWLNSDIIYNGNGGSEGIDLKKMLRIINGAEHVVSMDSWLKTYTLLCGIPTTVIKTRWNNRYRSYGEDVTDWIFLNRNIWPSLKLAKIEELLSIQTTSTASPSTRPARGLLFL